MPNDSYILVINHLNIDFAAFKKYRELKAQQQEVYMTCRDVSRVSANGDLRIYSRVFPKGTYQVLSFTTAEDQLIIELVRHGIPIYYNYKVPKKIPEYRDNISSADSEASSSVPAPSLRALNTMHLWSSQTKLDPEVALQQLLDNYMHFASGIR